MVRTLRRFWGWYRYARRTGNGRAWSAWHAWQAREVGIPPEVSRGPYG